MNKLLPIILGVVVLGGIAFVVFGMSSSEDSESHGSGLYTSNAGDNENSDGGGTNNAEHANWRQNEGAAASSASSNTSSHATTINNGNNSSSLSTGMNRSNGSSRIGRETAENGDRIVRTERRPITKAPNGATKSSGPVKVAEEAREPKVVVAKSIEPDTSSSSANKIPQQKTTLAERTSEFRTASNRLSNRRHTRFLRRAYGRVLERENDQLVPLSNVMVTDHQDQERTFTDDKGFFDFEVPYLDEGQETSGNTNPDDDRVKLKAVLDGYVLERFANQQTLPGQKAYDTISFTGTQLDSENGVDIVLVYQGSETVRIKVEGADNPSALTVAIESYESNTALADDPLFVSGTPDASGMVEFQVPPRQQLQFFACGPGYVGKGSPTWRGLNKDGNFYTLTVEGTPTYEVAGRVVDARTGEPIAGARIHPSDGRSISYTNVRGEYRFWTPKLESPSRLLHIHHPAYGQFREDVNDVLIRDRKDGPVQLLSSMGQMSDPLGGPWLATLRPLVRVKAPLTNAGNGQPFRDVASGRATVGYQTFQVDFKIDQNGVTSIDTPFFPWGAKILSFSAKPAGGNQTNYRVTFEPSLWNNSNEYTFNLSATKQ